MNALRRWWGTSTFPKHHFWHRMNPATWCYKCGRFVP